MADGMLDPITLLKPRRKITGISAILLPFTSDGAIDWAAFDAHLTRTVEAGLTPAVNMDTGYVNLLEPVERQQVLDRTRSVLGETPFVAGAFVADEEGAPFNRDGYAAAIEAITAAGGTPVIFQSHGLTNQSDDDLVASYAALGKLCDQFIGFELSSVFAPFGKIYSLEAYSGLMSIPQCIGAKHSSLRREPEWQRLQLRDAERPDFKVFTGNDHAIDMVMYGSDYLLGLSTFAPDLFGLRDSYWQTGDVSFYELNDLLQYLGFFAFRDPVPAYKHTAAMFLNQRGWISTDLTHAKSPTRPASDRAVLATLGRHLGLTMED